jgi:K+-sensing histidine kinase KdpD
MVAVVTAFSLAFVDVLRPANLDVLYLLVVFVSALQWGRRPALFAAVASALIFDFCFISPRFSFSISDLSYLVTTSVFMVVATATSTLAARARDLLREQAARTRAEAEAQAKDALLNRIAHELRAPLTTILGWVQMLQQNAQDAQRSARGLSGVERNARLLARLVDDLLDISRIHVGKLRVRLEPVALAPIVTRALDDAAMVAAEKHVAIRTEIKAVGTVLADEHRVEQVVVNLVSNALKFTPSGGCVSVTMVEVDGVARLSVADTGAGIPAEFIPHVFEPFAQGHTEHNHQGLGLGLAIVKHLIEEHHGRIAVQSLGRGQGTTFTIEFPLENAAGSAHADPPSAGAVGHDDHAVLY